MILKMKRMEINWDDIIEYKSYPRSMGFYSNKFKKIYLNPITSKYTVFHKYLVDHEKKHYILYNKYKNPVVLLILNTLHEWHTIFLYSSNHDVMVESTKCLIEFKKLQFSREEINEFNSQFLSKFLSFDWFNQKLLEYLRPDDYGMVLLVSTIMYCLSTTNIINYIFLNIIAFLIIRIVKKFLKMS